ncbi:MAG: site-specific integrase [Candidatus Brocadiae bacterium]|nr:site-specific integrase [Candidatus Brocadiia bacterium]
MSYLKDLRAFYNWLIKKKYKTDTSDWFEEIDQPVVINEGIKYISREDLAIFHNHVMMNRKFETEFQMYLYQAIFMTYMWCGTRFNETRKILRKNVELENRIIWLEAADTKSKRKDKVPIHSNLYPILKKYIQCRDAQKIDNPYLFFYTTKDRPISEKTLRRWMEKIKTTMKTMYHVKSPIRFHAMRHSLGHFSIKDGVDLPTVQKLLRHSSPDITTKYYVHTGNKELLEGIERYNPLGL